MSNGAIIELKAESVHYYSEYDEEAFFEWMDKIKSITEYKGRGAILSIFIDCEMVDQYALKELLSLFHRYRVDMKQLSVFEKDFSWLRKEGTYWFNSVFG